MSIESFIPAQYSSMFIAVSFVSCKRLQITQYNNYASECIPNNYPLLIFLKNLAISGKKQNTKQKILNLVFCLLLMVFIFCSLIEQSAIGQLMINDCSVN